MSIFKQQTLLTITLDCGTSVSSSTTSRVLYKKPNGDIGYWNGTPSGNYIIYSIQSGDIDQSGVWQFQAYAVLTGKIAYGEIVYKDIQKPIL